MLLAATELKAQALTHGAGILQCAVEDVRYEDGIVWAAQGGSVELAALGGKGIAFEATFHNTKHTYTYGSHVAHVAVDAETGHIDIVDYVAIEDAGRIINPLTLHGQAIGSIVQGLGGTLLEHFVYDDEGQMLSGSLADYLVPLATDFPNIRSSSIELRPSPNHPLGAKGAGEGGTMPTGGIIANAVAAALKDFGVQPWICHCRLIGSGGWFRLERPPRLSGEICAADGTIDPSAGQRLDSSEVRYSAVLPEISFGRGSVGPR